MVTSTYDELNRLKIQRKKGESRIVEGHLKRDPLGPGLRRGEEEGSSLGSDCVAEKPVPHQLVQRKDGVSHQGEAKGKGQRGKDPAREANEGRRRSLVRASVEQPPQQHHPNDEHTGILGGAEGDAPSSWRFSIDVARAWEKAFDEAETPATRKVAMRSAMTLSPDRGGVFDTLLGLARRGLGGSAGDGRQFISWIHYQDFVEAVRWLIAREDLAGPVNVAAPGPLPNREFMRTLRKWCGVPFGLPASRWMLEIGAALMGTETELILKSRRVVPARLLQAGFRFRYPAWSDAALQLCSEWRSLQREKAA